MHFSDLIKDMYTSRMICLRRKNGSAYSLFTTLKECQAFKYARFDLCARKCTGLQRLVIGFGQEHPVRHGKSSRILANRIGSVQAWLFNACKLITEKLHLTSFGKEGFSIEGDGVFHARLNTTVIASIKREIGDIENPRSLFRTFAYRWRRALHGENSKILDETMSCLDALNVLQAINPSVTVFPIEQPDVHGRIGQAMDQLRQQMSAIEQSASYKRYQQKGGKNLTKEEYDAAIDRNNCVKEYNRILKHPERERSILREVLEHSDGMPVTAFILGQGHRKAFLRLSKKHIPDDVLFVWITPPQLWIWKSIRYWTIVALLLAGLIAALSVYLFI